MTLESDKEQTPRIQIVNDEDLTTKQLMDREEFAYGYPAIDVNGNKVVVFANPPAVASIETKEFFDKVANLENWSEVLNLYGQKLLAKFGVSRTEESC